MGNKQSIMMRNLYIFLSLVIMLALLFFGKTTYYHLFPKAKIESDFKKAKREYEKTHEINVLQGFVNNNKDSIKKVSSYLIDTRDSIIVAQFNEVLRVSMASTQNSINLSRGENYRLTDKLIIIIKDQYPYVPDPNDEDKVLYDLFSELEPVEISEVIENQKSVVYIVKDHVWEHSYSSVDGMKNQGEAYRWKYLVYVIDLINRKTIAYREFLGGLPSSTAIKESNDKYFKNYGSEPSMLHIEIWYSHLPLQ